MNNRNSDTQEMQQRHLELHQAETRMAICPTCGVHSPFRFHGEQVWPEKVAKAAGFPERVSLWQCVACETTLLEPGLKFDDDQD